MHTPFLSTEGRTPSARQRTLFLVVLGLMVGFCGMSHEALAAAAAKPFLGEWGLIIPNLRVGWLGVAEGKDGQLTGSILWGRGLVFPIDSVKVEGDQLILVRNIAKGTRGVRISDGTSAAVDTKITITARVKGDKLSLVVTDTDAKTGDVIYKAAFSGTRLPPMPPAPDLSKVKFGSPITLFNGKDLTGWLLVDPQQLNNWSVKDGVLMSKFVEKSNVEKSGNLRTAQDFEDFELTLETRVPKKGNSGIFLRGLYEVQVSENEFPGLDRRNNGAIFGRIAPTVEASKPVGQWNTFAITLVQRHVTVVLNGKKIIDNQPVIGITSEGLWSDPNHPGPIWLQGGHTDVEYRNIVLRPVVK